MTSPLFNKKSGNSPRLGVCSFLMAALVFGMGFVSPGNAQTPGNGGVKKRIFTSGTAGEVATATNLSLSFLRKRQARQALISLDDFQVEKSVVDQLSMAHTRVQQTLGGVPVFGGEAIVHLNPDGSVASLTDALESNLFVNTVPTLTPEEAIVAAVQQYGCEVCLTAPPIADLWVFPHNGRTYLAYRVRLERIDPATDSEMPVYFIDAHTGEAVWEYNDLQSGSGPSLYNGTINFNTYLHTDNLYYMDDLARKIGTFDARNHEFDSTGLTIGPFTDANDVWDTSYQRAAISAQYAVEATWDYYKNTFGRDGIDGNGGPGVIPSINGQASLITSIVHYGTNYNNAFWQGSLKIMFFGDGDGVTYGPFTSLDVCGHELTHGVTQYTAGLTYSGESGAMNESISDVFGSMIERSKTGETSGTWEIGEDIYTPGVPGDALRFLSNPHQASTKGFTADDDPDHYSERYTGTADNGGVHINSGIPNYVFYLLAKGGTHHLGGTMAGIGPDSAIQIWYRALTTYMVSSTDFKGARLATLSAAADMYGQGSPEFLATATAWGLCGVGATPASNTPPVVMDDHFTVNGNAQTAVDTPGPLSNDTDANNDALSASLVDGPSHGTLTLARDGSFTYSPVAGYSGTDGFTYRANDGLADSATVGTVTLTVVPHTSLLLKTQPAGLQISYDGALVTAPVSRDSVAGTPHSLGAAPTQVVNNVTYVFDGWSDGAVGNHTVLTPAVNTTYTAVYHAKGTRTGQLAAAAQSNANGVYAVALNWSSDGTSMVEIHTGSPTGPLVVRSDRGPQSILTTRFVTPGTVFYLQDVSDHLPLTAANTLATFTFSP